MRRRYFLSTTMVAATGLLLSGEAVASKKSNEFVNNRPAVGDRTLVSKAVEAKIAEVRKAIRDDELRWLFENCFPNTLDTTVESGTRDGKPDSFVITGDIKALWLRDSTAQD